MDVWWARFDDDTYRRVWVADWLRKMKTEAANVRDYGGIFRFDILG